MLFVDTLNHGKLLLQLLKAHIIASLYLVTLNS